jgi:hypothetical protein
MIWDLTYLRDGLFTTLNKRHPMPDFKLIKPHGHERDRVIMLQAAYNQEHRAKVSRQR